MKVTLTSTDITMLRAALYSHADHLFELQARASNFERAKQYEADGNKYFQLAEQLKTINKMEGN